MKNKKFGVALFGMCLLGSQVLMADENFPVDENMNDLSFAFESRSIANYSPLSESEMVKTKGEFVWFIPTIIRAGYGAVGGFSSYYGSYAATGNWSPNGVVSAIAGGAIGGVVGYNPATSALLGSATGGFVSNYNW